MANGYRYAFPAYAGEVNMRSQFNHIGLEVLEAEDAWTREGDMRAAEELMDVIHAAETALRALDLPGQMLAQIQRGVVEKNRERGYYDAA